MNKGNKEKEGEKVITLLYLGAIVCLIICLILVINGCYSHSLYSDEDFEEEFRDPRIGLVINTGTTDLYLKFFDQTNHLVYKTYLKSASRFARVNGYNWPNYLVMRLNCGYYRVEIQPFFYIIDFTNIIIGKPLRRKIELPAQLNQVFVNCKNYQSSTPYIFNPYLTSQRWGWILVINGGDFENYLPYPSAPLPFGRFEFWINN
jgi:hypothetical protein